MIKKRIIKVISIPIMVILFLPITFISAILWIATGDYSISDLMEKYAKWLGNE